MQYLVYWVPKNNFSILEQRSRFKEFNITDKISKSKISCKLEFDGSKLLLRFNKPFEGKTVFEFNATDINLEEGFFIFVTYDEISTSLKQLLEEKIYHNFKELFHSHEHHGYDEDVILKGFMHNNIRQIKVETIKELLELFRRKFKARNNEIMDIILEIRSGKSKNIELILESINNIFSTLGEKTYFDFLCNLARKYRVNSKILEDICFDVENLSQNLQIFSEYLKIYKMKYDFKEAYYQTNIGVAATVYFTFTGLITGLITQLGVLWALITFILLTIPWPFIKPRLTGLLFKRI